MELEKRRGDGGGEKGEAREEKARGGARRGEPRREGGGVRGEARGRGERGGGKRGELSEGGRREGGGEREARQGRQAQGTPRDLKTACELTETSRKPEKAA